MLTIDSTQKQRLCLTLEPNESASLSWNYKMIALLAIPPFIFGVGFSVFGLWVILPFAGVEVVVLLLVTKIFFQNNAKRETIVFLPHQVHIEKQCQGRPVTSVQWPRAWTRIVVEGRSSEYCKPRVYFRAYGEKLEVGSFLNHADAKCLIRELRQATRFFDE